MATAAGVGLSTLEETPEAGRQAARRALERSGAQAADWALVFATPPHRPRYAAMLAEVQTALGTRAVSGCSGWGVLATAEEVEARPAVAVLAVRSDRMTAESLLAPIGDDHGRGAAESFTLRIASRRAGSPGGRDLLVLLPDPFAARPDQFLGALAEGAPGTPIVGAAASCDPRMEQTFQFHGRNVATRALAGLHLCGALSHAIGITQGCQPLGRPARITRGDGNILFELDGRPAVEALRALLPQAMRDSLDRLGSHLFVAFPPDPGQDRIEPGEYLVRSLIGIDRERGALILGTQVRPGQLALLAVRDPQAARDDLKRMLERLRPAPGAPRPAFGFYFNCAARGTSLHGMPGIDTAYIGSAFGDLPIVGFFGNAEIAPLRGQNHLFTHTGVLALVGEA